MVFVHGVALSSKEIVIWSSLSLVGISLAPAVISSTISTVNLPSVVFATLQQEALLALMIPLERRRGASPRRDRHYPSSQILIVNRGK